MFARLRAAPSARPSASARRRFPCGTQSARTGFCPTLPAAAITAGTWVTINGARCCRISHRSNRRKRFPLLTARSQLSRRAHYRSQHFCGLSTRPANRIRARSSWRLYPSSRSIFGITRTRRTTCRSHASPRVFINRLLSAHRAAGTAISNCCIATCYTLWQPVSGRRSPVSCCWKRPWRSRASSVTATPGPWIPTCTWQHLRWRCRMAPPGFRPIF